MAFLTENSSNCSAQKNNQNINRVTPTVNALQLPFGIE